MKEMEKERNPLKAEFWERKRHREDVSTITPNLEMIRAKMSANEQRFKAIFIRFAQKNRNL